MKMAIKLNAPGMTSLHKAGLAGLYMTLQAFDETGVKIKGLDWQLAPTSVMLSWQDETSAAAFNSLIQKSFWRDEAGFVRLAGLEGQKPPTTEQKYHLYIALLNSFLQFGPHRPTGNKRPLSYEIDDRLYWIKEFAPIKEFRHQEAVKDFIDTKGRFKRSIGAGSWLYPG